MHDLSICPRQAVVLHKGAFLRSNPNHHRDDLLREQGTGLWLTRSSCGRVTESYT